MSYMQILLIPIAILSVVTNFSIIILILRNRTWLSKPYNVFIFSLSFTDMFTGVVMLITPNTVFKETINIPSNRFIGTIFCKIMWFRWLLFALGAVSVYTCLFLTVERWTAICRPFKYRVRFASRYVIGYIVLIWFLGLTTSSIGALEPEFVPKNSNNTAPFCKITPIARANLIGLVTIISVSAKFVIPSVIIIVLYTLAILKIKKNERSFPGQKSRNQTINAVTKMAAAASVGLVLCWLPNQIYFILVKYRMAEMFTHIHNCTSVIVLLSSTLNPFIYGLWGKHYRAGMKAALRCFGRHVDRSAANAGVGNKGFYVENKQTLAAPAGKQQETVM